MSDPPGTPVTGLVEAGFEPVRDAFARNFDEGREVGAGFCVHVDGHKVVDIVGGTFDTDDPTSPYGPDTLQVVFSSTKGATAACANLLAQRGELDVDAPVATYWPEFAQTGKDDLPVRYLLSHQAGLPAVDARLSAEDLRAWDPIVEALAAQRPFWEPGTAHGYHAVSYGYLVGEVVRRITGRSLGAFFADEIARPLGIEFYIGLPAELEPRVSPIVAQPIGGGARAAGGGAPSDYGKTLQARALNLGGGIRDPRWMNEPEWHAAEMPAGNGITNASGLSRLYAGFIGTVEGGPAGPLLTPDQIERARTPLTSGRDLVFASVGMPLEQKIGLGFWRCSAVTRFGGRGSFGHAGAGGSYGFADPEHGLAVGYAMNKMATELIDPRPHDLLRAVYASIGAEADAKYC
jgi:CubicO group peptidase (beta-lactamase class C family)